MVLVIDNYDSFTYNLVQYLGEFTEVEVVRNDHITLQEIEAIQPDQIIISPGPGRPADAGISEEAIKYFYNKLPILGVCLGHQCIGKVFGGRIVRCQNIFHGKISSIIIDQEEKDPIFATIENQFIATRYHSLLVERESFPDDLKILAETKNKEIMAIVHRQYPVYGLQFHPESILTEKGKTIINNFLNLQRRV